MKWEDDGAWLGECMTRNTGESPNAAAVSRLSQILEETPQEKYSLSAKACQGILRRAERRGKDLPEMLKQVLIQQSQGASPQERTEATGSGNGLGIGKDGDPSPTFTVGDRHGVAIGINGDIAGTLDASYYKGCGARSGNEREVVGTPAVLCAGFKPGNSGQAWSIGYQEGLSTTLNTMPGAQAVMCEDVAHTLRTKENCAYREDAETYPVQNMVVRRLTPMECERLQGFPDHWTDIGEWTDEKGKKHKDADSPRYKALGNSIALPFWDWMLRRMARYLPEGATLGSLFDGIGGFPLIWERIHGEGTARWASEIEQFPIAVTKVRFPEEREDGI